ncbi:branched-chain amino acid uptake carrier [Fictibacillus macauensis ZFHKF-1]|uniref:Branched-chain amino acid transport system carrier protein n=1 Tax=Fictibacillus macauensis ZFHKF-1 TaxID=1196324 RepID=I8UAF4_9BACL|nr:branched-chain amino acid transport system II carrier protein [Fictibacillus macauensis]EIT83925.1 branched-chain amino acid uptake carrier [Fictibacillus macauensis ZFHKF-1]
MSTNKQSSQTLVIGLMLFALFFGAGNLIFPAMLGQSAGSNVWEATIGFLITGVAMPLLGVFAFGISGSEDLQSLGNRVHPWFSAIYTFILYLSIGPLFALPRAGSVSFEIGVKPFLNENAGHLPLAIFTIVFFGLSCVLSLNPTKIVDVVGKVLTPLKLTFIGVLVLAAIIRPIGAIQAPTKEFLNHSFFTGFQQGYLTMDTLAAFVFGIIIINAIKTKQGTNKRSIAITCAKASGIAALVLVIVYSALSYMGASSVSKLGHFSNGGEVLAAVANYYFGSLGNVFLGLMIVIACLTTSVGLITSCAAYFHKVFPKISYRVIAVVLSVFSALVANIGLNQLIKISVPVLTAIYPIAIMLIFLTFAHSLFKGRRLVYQLSLLFTFIVSVFDGLKAAEIPVSSVTNVFANILPFYSTGLGWVVPALVGGVIGYILSLLLHQEGQAKMSKEKIS